EPNDITTILINVTSASCGQSISLFPTLQPCQPDTNGGQPCEITPFCPAGFSVSECNGGYLPGMVANIYIDTVTLPLACTDWIFSFDVCCRTAGITTLQDPQAH